jgi:hypothetical protein
VPVSESAEIIVEISLTASEARACAPGVTAWLLDREVMIRNESRDTLDQPSEFLAGPRYEEAAPDEYKQVANSANSGVDVVVKRELYHPVENYELPRCPHCGVEIDYTYHHDLVEPWLQEAEPTATCVACGRTALLGDWDGRGAYHVGELAVVFHNWPPLKESFAEELGERLGPRWRKVFEHI